MTHDALRGFLQLGFFIFAAGLCSAVLQPRESGEFVISICSSSIGLILIVGSVILWRFMK
jgi:uncharacterized membrane protein